MVKTVYPWWLRPVLSNCYIHRTLIQTRELLPEIISPMKMGASSSIQVYQEDVHIRKQTAEQAFPTNARAGPISGKTALWFSTVCSAFLPIILREGSWIFQDGGLFFFNPELTRWLRNAARLADQPNWLDLSLMILGGTTPVYGLQKENTIYYFFLSKNYVRNHQLMGIIFKCGSILNTINQSW